MSHGAEPGNAKRRKERTLPDFATAPAFTIEEAVTYSRASRSTIQRRMRDGTLKVKRLGKNSPRIVGDSLRRWIREGTS
jgi:hypothetical protein